jgi:hypothetical protein
VALNGAAHAECGPATVTGFEPQEGSMFQFIRTVEAKNAAMLPAALQFAAEVTTYVNKTYALGLKYGMEVFSGATLHWHFQTDSLDKITAIHTKLLQDRDYGEMLTKAKDLWVDGTFKDTIVSIVGP